MPTRSKSLSAAIGHFEQHADALREKLSIERDSKRVGAKLEELSSAEKPDFSTVSALQAERQHHVDRLKNANETIARLEGTYVQAGNTLYNELLRARSLAGEAAVECVHARLRDDFSGATLQHVSRWHPVVMAEAQRDANAPHPRDFKDFAGFAECVPAIVAEIDQCERRAEIYKACASTRSLPDQKKLDAATPTAAKPVKIAPRRERTEAEEADRALALESPENRHLRELYSEGQKIAATFNETALAAFVAKHPEIARFFPRLGRAA